MPEKLLPPVQLLLGVLFAAAAIFGPMLTRDARGLVLSIAGIGLLLGAVTLAIGWLAFRRRAVEYPFAAWSLRVLKVFAGESQVRALESSRRAAGARHLRALGIASFVLGGLLLAAVLAVTVYVSVYNF